MEAAWPQLKVLIEVAVAMALGGLIGYEREIADRPAGLRTHMLLAGACALIVGLGGAMLEAFGGAHPSLQRVVGRIAMECGKRPGRIPARLHGHEALQRGQREGAIPAGGGQPRQCCCVSRLLRQCRRRLPESGQRRGGITRAECA